MLVIGAMFNISYQKLDYQVAQTTIRLMVSVDI